MAVDYKELLNEKVQDEYESFIAELKGMPSEKVIEHAYEKVIKEDLVICIENGDFSRAEAKALYQKKCPLDFCYREWLETDCSHMDMLERTVNETADRAYREMKLQNRESR